MFGRLRQSSDRLVVPREGLAGRRWGGRRVALAALVATVCFFGDEAPASPLVRADDAVLWIMQPDVPLGESGTGLRLIHARVGDWFTGYARYPVRRGKIYCAAVADGQLHAFFGDGTYYSFRRSAAPRRLPAARAVQQQRLPGGFLPLAVAGDPADGALLAIVPVHVALRVVEENRRQERLLADEDEPGHAGPASQPQGPAEGIDPASGRYWLVKYAPRRWELVEALPEFFSASVTAKLAASDGIMALVWRAPSSGRAADLQYAERLGGQWRHPETIPQSAEVGSISLAWLEDEPVLVGLRPDQSDPSVARVVVFRRRAGAWEMGELLGPGGEALSLPPDQTGPASCGGQVVVAVAEDAETVRWGLWPVEGGGPVRDFQLVPNLVPPRSTVLAGRWAQIASYVCLVLLLTTVFWRRQESLLKPADLPVGFGPAGFGRRAGGFVLDFLPVVVVTGPVWGEPLQEALMAYAEQPEQIHPFLERLWLPSLLTRCAYAAYCLVWELWRGNTPGKMAMHCGVCAPGGRPCTRRQLLVRNLFRIIELEPLLLVWPLLLLLVLTRNRQRLGDMWAHTLVIQRVPARPVSGSG